VGGGVWAGGHLFGCLIGCFVPILNFCIFLEMLRCQLVSGGLKTPLYTMTVQQQHSSKIMSLVTSKVNSIEGV
jgi:hypothetical protein